MALKGGGSVSGFGTHHRLIYKCLTPERGVDPNLFSLVKPGGSASTLYNNNKVIITKLLLLYIP